MKTETEEKIKEVSKYILDNFHHEKKCYFSSHINLITKSNGDKYNSLYCFYSPDEDDESMYGVALLWRKDKEDGFMDGVDGFMFFETGMEYIYKEVAEEYELNSTLFLSFNEMSVVELMPLIRTFLLKKIKVEDNAIELHNEFHDIQREYRC